MLSILFFEGGNRTHFLFSQKQWCILGKKSKDNVAFSKSTLKFFLKRLIQSCYFMVGNSLLRQEIGTPMGNLLFYTYENEYMSELISNDKVKACHFHATKRFIDDLGTLNDGGAFNDFYKDIYPTELQLKVEHSGTYATFLNLDITLKDGVFVYKLFDKPDGFLFFIVCIPYIDSNIPKSIFYSALLDEFLRIAHSSHLYEDFNEKAMNLLNRMKAQGSQSLRCRKALMFSV